MITGRREDFESRLRQRGYTLEEVRACIVSDDGNMITVDQNHPAYPKQAKRGLGDIVADGLAAVGITKERVSAVVGKPCGCGQRQAAMNAAGAKYLGLPPGRTSVDSP